MELRRTQRIAYTVVAVLAVLLIVVLIYLQLQRAGPAVPAGPDRLTVEGLRPEDVSSAFDLGILSDERYQALDKSLFEAGRVPVPVPGARGKPNLF